METEKTTAPDVSPEYAAKLKALLREVGEEIAGEIAEEQVRKLAEARANGDGMFTNPFGGAVPSHDERDKKPGIGAARAALAVARAKAMGGTAAQHARSLWGAEDSVTRMLSGSAKAMQADDFDQGGSMVRETHADELIDALQPLTVVRSLGPDIQPNPTGTLVFDKITSAPTATWIGEGENANATQANTGNVIATAKPLAAIVPVSNKLLRYGGPRVEESIRRHLLRSLRVAEDSAFIRGDGTSASPKGLRNWALAANVAASAAGSVPASVTLANVTKDFGSLMQALMDANVDLFADNSGYIIEPRTWQYLYTVRDGNGNLVFKDEMDGGTLFGFPFRVTSQIPRNLDASGDGDNDETEVIFAAFANVVVADSLEVELTALDGAAYHDGSNVQAGFSKDQTVIRAILETDLVARHAEAIAVRTAVVWGA